MLKYLVGHLLLTLALVFPLPASAQLNVNINISVPPPVTIVEPPRLVVMPETYVYVAPELDVDIFFYDGWWWRSWENRWYRSRSYSSGWVYYRYEPVFYQDIPRDWRRSYRERRWREYHWDHQPIPYHEVEQNWRDWQERRYWERDRTWGVKGLHSSTSVQVDVHISTPPPIHVERPPELVVIPETYVYVAPGVDIDIFFYDGWWWRSWENRWYRSRSYSSDWVYYQYIPVFYRDIPRDWRRYYKDRRWREHHWDYRPIPYREVERNWRSWEDKRYWQKQKNWNIRVKKPKRPPQPHKVVHPKSQPYYYDGQPATIRIYKETGPPPHKGGKKKHDNQPKGKPHKEKGGKHK